MRVDYIHFSKKDIGSYLLDGKKSYDCLIKVSGICEVYRDGKIVTMYTEDTKHDFECIDAKNAKQLYDRIFKAIL